MCPFSALRNLVGEQIVFPSLGIAYYTLPLAGLGRGKGSVVFDRQHRLEAEYFNMGPRLAAEMQTCRHNLGVIEHHNCIVGKKRRQISEN